MLDQAFDQQMLPEQAQPQQMLPEQVQPQRKSRLLVGLFGFILGPLGIYNFYLGRIGRGITQLLMSFSLFITFILLFITSSALGPTDPSTTRSLLGIFTLLFVVSVGLTIAAAIWAFVETICYLVSYKPRWNMDAKGIQLAD